MCRSSEALQVLKSAKKPMVIVGSGVLRRDDRDALLQKVGRAGGARGLSMNWGLVSVPAIWGGGGKARAGR